MIACSAIWIKIPTTTLNELSISGKIVCSVALLKNCTYYNYSLSTLFLIYGCPYHRTDDCENLRSLFRLRLG